MENSFIVDTDYFTHSVREVDDFLDSHDFRLEVDVSKNNHPDGNDYYGTFRSGLMRVRDYERSKIEMFRRSHWYNENGIVVINQEIIQILDNQLKSYLKISRKAELISNKAELPVARIQLPTLRTRLKRWIEGR